MKIEEILGNEVIVSFDYIGEYDELINHYVLFSDKRKIIGEIINIKKNQLVIKLLGEIIDNNFIFGITNKPSNNANIELINKEATSLINSYPDGQDSLYLGHNTVFTDLKINMNITNFFNISFGI